MRMTRLMRVFVFGFCLCGIFSYTIVAQKTVVSSFELSQYEFQADASEQVDLSLSVILAQANTVVIDNPFQYAAIAVELVKKIESAKSTDYWLTADSLLFLKDLPQTAWVKTHGKSVIIRTATSLKSGDQLIVRLRVSIPGNERAEEANDPEGKRMTISVSHSSTPGTTLKYESIKPILMKRRGPEK